MSTWAEDPRPPCGRSASFRTTIRGCPRGTTTEFLGKVSFPCHVLYMSACCSRYVHYDSCYIWRQLAQHVAVNMYVMDSCVVFSWTRLRLSILQLFVTNKWPTDRWGLVHKVSFAMFAVGPAVDWCSVAFSIYICMLLFSTYMMMHMIDSVFIWITIVQCSWSRFCAHSTFYFHLLLHAPRRQC